MPQAQPEFKVLLDRQAHLAVRKVLLVPLVPLVLLAHKVRLVHMVVRLA